MTSTECRTSSSVPAAVVASGVWAAVSEVIVGPSGAPVAPPSVPMPVPAVVAAPPDALFADCVECSALRLEESLFSASEVLDAADVTVLSALLVPPETEVEEPLVSASRKLLEFGLEGAVVLVSGGLIIAVLLFVGAISSSELEDAVPDA